MFDLKKLKNFDSCEFESTTISFQMTVLILGFPSWY